MNIVAALMSIILILLLLNYIPPLYILYYLVSMPIIAAIVFTLRVYFLKHSRSKTSKRSEETPVELEEGPSNKRMLLLMFLMSILLLISPVLLAKMLDPYVWFVFLVSFITGVSIAEILFYFYPK